MDHAVAITKIKLRRDRAQDTDTLEDWRRVELIYWTWMRTDPQSL